MSNKDTKENKAAEATGDLPATAASTAAVPAPTTAAPVETASEQPVEFPQSFEEWDSSQPPATRVLRAGFRHFIRQQGKIQEQLLAKEWDQLYAAFQASAPQ